MREHWWFHVLCILSTTCATPDHEHIVTCNELKTLYRDSENDGEKSCCDRDDEYLRTLVFPALELGEIIFRGKSRPDWNLMTFGATELWDTTASSVRVVVPDVNKLHSVLEYAATFGMFNHPPFPVISLLVKKSRANPEELVNAFASVTNIYKL